MKLFVGRETPWGGFMLWYDAQTESRVSLTNCCLSVWSHITNSRPDTCEENSRQQANPESKASGSPVNPL